MIKIGIVAQDQPENKFGVNRNYLEFIYKFGIPIMIAPVDLNEFIESYKIDALVLPGGADVNSQRYSDYPRVGNGQSNIYLEHFDVKILPSLIGKMPIFGICRGLQTLNVHFGGTLKNIWWHPYSNYDTDLCHKIKTNDGKNQLKLDVNSFHHQAIDRLGDELKIEAKSIDGYIEAISCYDKRIFAVQWHPERINDEYSISKFKEILK